MIFFNKYHLSFILHFFQKFNPKKSFSNMLLFKMFHLIFSFPFYFQLFVFPEILTLTNYSIKIRTAFLQSVLSHWHEQL